MSDDYGLWVVYYYIPDNVQVKAVYEGTEHQVRELMGDISPHYRLMKLPPVIFIDSDNEHSTPGIIMLPPVNPSNKGNPAKDEYEITIGRNYDGEYEVSIECDDGTSLHSGLKYSYGTERGAKKAAARAVKKDRERRARQAHVSMPTTYKL
jgi:hypothetical protein